MPTSSFPGVESVIDDIAKCELRYRDGTEKKLGEEELLELLDSYLPPLVYAFDSRVPSPRERGGDLALEKEFYEWRKTTSGDPDARRAAVIRSFLATETERRGQFRLSRTQTGRIAAHYDAIGKEFVALGMPGHAMSAFQSAADLFLQLQQKPKRELSLLNLRRAQQQARPRGPARFFEAMYDAICGYGYRPFRMLGWMALTLLVFSVAVWLCGPAGYVRSLHGCLINFLNPLSFGDLDGAFSGAGQVLLVIESYFGSISMAIFFAFLVRD
ncbi:hypothetical protein KGQ20_03310 [Catenulispora sp. NF23]|uniref:Uncharacterized protein n=1 Tax=Catenulispora pinistramenti TaxID=2705254 RepID=A0ABS5KNR2_9ACTN|nr:hypothetical protein [Catenulispora pinistramenti]MBS2531794.1 hypothetical protein [Catenulispora pinistramenti]MBS2547660.1 hypothetical protein [Catenulispora pinistramenti]